MSANAFPYMDFHDFHLHDLPARLASGHGVLAARAARELPAICFRLANSDNAYTYSPRADTIDICAGTEADTIVELEHEAWQGLVYDLESAPGLLYSGKIAEHGGDQMLFVRWEPALRAMFHGRPLYDSNQPLKNAAGHTLAADSAFTLDDDAASINEFLQAAGYALIKGVFNADEIAQFRHQAEQLKQRARQGDKVSWWGQNDGGATVLCRVTDASVIPVFKALYDDTRMQQIEQLLPEELVATGSDEVDGVTVIYKNPAMVEGLSDLPWHRDCGLGGHAVMCPKVICSIYLYDATEQAGPLRFLPGSHKASYGFMEATGEAAAQGIAVQAQAGDVSLHYSDVMHAAPPPAAVEGPHRVSILLSYDRRHFKPHGGARHYNDRLLSREDGQVDHLQKVIDRY